MSAFIVDKEHIDLLVTAGLEFRSYGPLSWWHEATGKRYELTPQRAHEVGQMLWAENLASLVGRYPNDGSGERPGPIDFEDDMVLTYRYQRIPGVPDIATVAKAVHCYEYQSCEHDGWKTSQARAFCQALEHACVTRMPGYEAAPWGFTDRNYFVGSGA